MEREIDTGAGRINGTYGDVAWTPLRYVNRSLQPDGTVGPLSHGARGHRDPACGMA